MEFEATSELLVKKKGIQILKNYIDLYLFVTFFFNFEKHPLPKRLEIIYHGLKSTVQSY